MRQLFIDSLFLIIITLVIQLILPWWGIMIVGFLYGLMIRRKPEKVFLHAFLAVFLLWTGLVMYIHLINDGILAGRLAQLAGISAGWMVVFLTGLTGGIAAAVAALNGHYIRKVFYRRSDRSRKQGVSI